MSSLLRLPLIGFVLLLIAVCAYLLGVYSHPSVAIAGANPPSIELVSVALDGGEADDRSSAPSVSGDGRYVAFASMASNLVFSDTNGVEDVFLRDIVEDATIRVSVGLKGAETDGVSTGSTISGDGRYIAFMSTATNLVLSDTNGAADAFVFHRDTGEITRVSVSSAGAQADSGITDGGLCISSVGPVVVFASDSDDLVEYDTNRGLDFFAHDMATGETERVSITADGQQGSHPEDFLGGVNCISEDGRYVSFVSWMQDWVENDTNNNPDVFLRDRAEETTLRVSLNSGGAQRTQSSAGGNLSAYGQHVSFASMPEDPDDATITGGSVTYVHNRTNLVTDLVSRSWDNSLPNGPSGSAVLSGNGRFAAFTSSATNIVPGDTNGAYDVFVRDRREGRNLRVSVSNAGAQGNNGSFVQDISRDGRFVVFVSDATNLVPGDINNAPDVFLAHFEEGDFPPPPSPTPTATVTSSPSATATATATNSPTRTSTPTSSPTRTVTGTPSLTPTPRPSGAGMMLYLPMVRRAPPPPAQP